MIGKANRFLHMGARGTLDALVRLSARMRNIHPPLLATYLPDAKEFNERLGKSLLQMSEEIPDAVSNSRGGPYFSKKWLSSKNLHQFDDPDIRRLKQFVEAFANDRLQLTGKEMLSMSSMWSIASERGMTGKAHNHQGKVSGVYYVDPGTAGDSMGGLLQFHACWGDKLGTQPLFGVSVWGESVWPTRDVWNDQIAEYSRGNPVVRPKAGLLLLFPSHLIHSVEEYVGTEKRIVVSFNLQ